ncbi:DNA sulfur modification protein DndE [Sphaerisporangium sp. NPDC049003]|uniref:DNA sulfur modification protein DndE n=1 Tax=Sphaerisporangium sp. NPDC049003 TaxID=3364517 RepID=UPI00371BE670
MSLDTIRLSQPAKDQLIKLKRVTGIKNWNILCRWGLTVSLADRTVPLVQDLVMDSNIEMSWRTFAGQYSELYRALLVQRCQWDNLPTTDEQLAHTLSIHVHRGIGYLAAQRELSSVASLIRYAIERTSNSLPV